MILKPADENSVVGGGKFNITQSVAQGVVNGEVRLGTKNRIHFSGEGPSAKMVIELDARAFGQSTMIFEGLWSATRSYKQNRSIIVAGNDTTQEDPDYTPSAFASYYSMWVRVGPDGNSTSAPSIFEFFSGVGDDTTHDDNVTRPLETWQEPAGTDQWALIGYWGPVSGATAVTQSITVGTSPNQWTLHFVLGQLWSAQGPV